MNAPPGTLRGGGVPFGTTHWSVVGACRADGEMRSAEAHAALGRLCRDYWPPLYTFVRRRGYSAADAQDLVQGFFAAFLQHRAYLQAERSKGKFRSFMLASLKHFIANSWDREHALKRGGHYRFVLLDAELEAAEALHRCDSGNAVSDEDEAYQQHWASTLVSCALNHLAAEFSDKSKGEIFHELRPFLCGGVTVPSQADVAARLGIPIGTLRSHLSRLRTRYAELLREEIARTIGAADDVEEELRHFRRIVLQ